MDKAVNGGGLQMEYEDRNVPCALRARLRQRRGNGECTSYALARGHWPLLIHA